MSLTDWKIYDSSTSILDYEFEDDFSTGYSNGDWINKSGAQGDHWIPSAGSYGWPVVTAVEIKNRVSGLGSWDALSGSDYITWPILHPDDVLSWYGYTTSDGITLNDNFSLPSKNYEFEMWFTPFVNGNYGAETDGSYNVEWNILAWAGGSYLWKLDFVMGHQCTQGAGGDNDWTTYWQDHFDFEILYGPDVSYKIWNKNVE